MCAFLSVVAGVLGGRQLDIKLRAGGPGEGTCTVYQQPVYLAVTAFDGDLQ